MCQKCLQDIQKDEKTIERVWEALKSDDSLLADHLRGLIAVVKKEAEEVKNEILSNLN